MARPANTIPLLVNANATGSAQDWDGGRAVFMVEGTISGATLQLQYQSPQGTWLAVSGASATAAGASAAVEVPPGQVRCLVTGGTPSALYAWLKQTGVPG